MTISRVAANVAKKIGFADCNLETELRFEEDILKSDFKSFSSNRRRKQETKIMHRWALEKYDSGAYSWPNSSQCFQNLTVVTCEFQISCYAVESVPRVWRRPVRRRRPLYGESDDTKRRRFQPRISPTRRLREPGSRFAKRSPNSRKPTNRSHRRRPYMPSDQSSTYSVKTFSIFYMAVGRTVSRWFRPFSTSG